MTRILRIGLHSLARDVESSLLFSYGAHVASCCSRTRSMLALAVAGSCCMRAEIYGTIYFSRTL